MQYRRFGRIGWRISSIGFGAWALGADWGPVDDAQATATLRAAVESGINLFDTADVYGDGRSERRLAALRADFPDEEIHIVTKAGRRLNPHVADGYNAVNLERFVDRSLKNLGAESLELVQLHCPPTDVYYRPEVFDALDDLKRRGKVRHYGVSVEKVEEGLKAIEYPGVESVQIIINMFRRRPLERFLDEAAARDAAVLARVPLASGLLTGKMSPATEFTEDDHRAYNRHGEAFDVGETFSGVDFNRGLDAVEEVRGLLPAGMTMAQFALRWILMFPQVSTVIPGAKTPAQALDNAAAAEFPELSPNLMQSIADVYDEFIRSSVHHRW